MNCSNCHMPLENDARFCRNCGSLVSMPAQPQAPNSYPPQSFEDTPTIPTAPWQPQQAPQSQQSLHIPQHMPTQYMPPSQNVPPYAAPTQSMQSYQGEVPPQPGTFQQPVMLQPGSFQQQGPQSQPGNFVDNGPGNPSAPSEVAPKRRRRRGCFSGCLVTLIVLVLLLTGGWFLLARPYLHNLAASQINNVLTTGINQIPAQVTQVPPGVFPVQENTLNNLITLETAPSDPVQHMVASITPANMTINFQVYGYGCTVTGIPAAQNGHLVVTNVNVQGLASLIMSSDELTALLNQKLAVAQAKLDHPVTGVQLKNQELDLVLGPPGSV
ncbi:MAG: zinc ribbon domain-containing protein [Ktedonobacteraceae bacterium]